MPDVEEILDLVNKDDEVIGQISRSQFYKDMTATQGFIRTTNLLIVNSKSELWIPRRALDLYVKPGGLDFSVGGHVSTGESYATTMLREAEEEANLKLRESDLLFIGMLTPEDLHDHYFSANYVYFSDDSPKYGPKEFISDEWLAPEVLLKRLAAGEYAKDSLAPTVELWLQYQKTNGLVAER